MKFTIVIPVYNSSVTIYKVLNSVKSQTLTDYEVVIVNDGSIDDSAEIIEGFITSNPHLKIRMISTENKGVSKARNLGIRSSSSDYIALLDSDDIWHPQKLELVSLVLDDEYSFFGHSSTLNDFSKFHIDLKNINFKVYGFKDFILKNRFVTPSVIFKNDGTFFFDETMTHTEDHDLWLRMSYKKKALFLDIPLVKLNRPVLSSGGASSSKWKMRKGEIKMYLKATKYSLFCRLTFPFLVIFSISKYLKNLTKF